MTRALTLLFTLLGSTAAMATTVPAGNLAAATLATGTSIHVEQTDLAAEEAISEGELQAEENMDAQYLQMEAKIQKMMQKQQELQGAWAAY